MRLSEEEKERIKRSRAASLLGSGMTPKKLKALKKNGFKKGPLNPRFNPNKNK